MLSFSTSFYSHSFFSSDGFMPFFDSWEDLEEFKPSSFPSFDDYLPLPLGEIKRVWTVLNLTCVWVIELLTKIMGCFQQIHKKQLFNPSIYNVKLTSESDKLKNLRKLFQHPVDYEMFRDKILNYKNFFYNNYGFDAFFQIKNVKLSVFEDCKTRKEQKIEASMVVYDAIVDLYINRFLDHYPELDDEKYLPCLRTIALATAIKISWDESIDNISFRHFMIPYMGTAKHYKMEIAFLEAIDWNTSTEELTIHDQSEAFEEENFNNEIDS